MEQPTNSEIPSQGSDYVDPKIPSTINPNLVSKEPIPDLNFVEPKPPGQNSVSETPMEPQNIKRSKMPFIIISIIILVVLGGGGYLVYERMSKNENGVENEGSSQSANTETTSSKTVSLQTSAHDYGNITLSLKRPETWIIFTKETDKNNYYVDADVTLFPSLDDQQKEESFQTEMKKWSKADVFSDPEAAAYFSQPDYVRYFARDSRFINGAVYRNQNQVAVDLKKMDEGITSRPIFDKVLIENDTKGNVEYRCLQSTKDSKYLVNCEANIGKDYFGIFALFTNAQNYTSDINVFYEIINSINVKPREGTAN